ACRTLRPLRAHLVPLEGSLVVAALVVRAHDAEIAVRVLHARMDHVRVSALGLDYRRSGGDGEHQQDGHGTSTAGYGEHRGSPLSLRVSTERGECTLRASGPGEATIDGMGTWPGTAPVSAPAAQNGMTICEP